jgi:sRNA-binding protein
MAKQTVNLGSRENAGNGDALRVAFAKINSNFDELYSINEGTLRVGLDGGAASTVFDSELNIDGGSA